MGGDRSHHCIIPSGSEQALLFGQGIAGKGAGQKNGATKSEPARELLIFEFLAFADERSDPIG